MGIVCCRCCQDCEKSLGVDTIDVENLPIPKPDTVIVTSPPPNPPPPPPRITTLNTSPSRFMTLADLPPNPTNNSHEIIYQRTV